MFPTRHPTRCLAALPGPLAAEHLDHRSGVARGPAGQAAGLSASAMLRELLGAEVGEAEDPAHDQLVRPQAMILMCALAAALSK